MGLKTDFPARHWYRTSALSLLLLPLSWIFGAVVRLRRLAYRMRLARSERLSVPVVVVGNLVVGGSGKTPLVLWLADALRRRGYSPGIVSRGYGGTAPHAAPVPPGGDPRLFGDEPVLLAERSGCPVWIGRNRVEAARALLATHTRVTALVLDDGLQHYALARDVEIAVEDERGMGNGFLLPAGPLREPAGRPVDARVVNGAPASGGAFAMRLVPCAARFVHDPGRTIAIEALAGKRLHAVAGIGNPDRFFATLAALGLRFEAHPFPDHHRFTAQDLEFADCDLVLMTEKDAVKCRSIPRDDLVWLAVQAEIDERLADLVVEKLSGRPTA